MRLVMTLVVRNEQDILATNLDYHLNQGVDHVIVTDHGSTDATPEILQRYVREGSATVLRDEEPGHHQGRRVTAMARMAVDEQPADWVIHNDADEFWWPLAGSLRDVFGAIPDHYGQIVVDRHDFPPVPEAEGLFWERLVYRQASSRNRIGLPLEPKVAHRPHPGVVIAPGNHALSGAELRPVPLPGLVEVLHFPMRSFEQWEQKVIQTGVGLELVDDRGPDIGRDQLELLAAQRESRLTTEWQAALLQRGTLEDRLASGELIHDTRLSDFMRSPPPLPRAEGDALQGLLGAALATSIELESAVGRARELERSLTAAEDARRADERALAQLRSSRLLRWSAPVRRAFYRRRGR